MKVTRSAHPIIALALAWATILPAMGQKPETRRDNEAEKLMQEYRFDDAAKLIQKEINADKRKGKSTVLLEGILQQAQRGSEMLRGTERVIIIDSIVVNRDNFLSAYRLSQGSGTLGPLSELLPGAKGKYSSLPAFKNDFGDAVFFAAPDSAGLLKLFSSNRLGTEWSTPQQLTGMGGADDIQGYPFVMPDGTTLYYAAQGSESLGGYDIFVTRYNNATGEYVKAENVGMPFNSPANDYMMAIDEAGNIGWFVSDRNQPADKVCIYRFIPNAVREVYDLSSENEGEVRRLARIASLAESHTDAQAVKAALGRIADIRQGEQKSGTNSELFVIDDSKAYTSFQQFKVPAARQLAQQAIALRQQLKEKTSQLEKMRMAYHEKRMNDAAGILHLENETQALHRQLHDTEKAMRRAELGK